MNRGLIPPTFSPAVPPMQTQPRPEMLGRFVPTAMRRLSPVAKVQRPTRVLLLGLISAGVIPLLQLRERWAKVTTLQSQQFALSAELLNCHLDAPEVTEAAKAITPSKAMTLLSGVAVLTAIGAFLYALVVDAGFNLSGVRALYTNPPQTPAAWVWVISVSAGYLIVLLQINQHVAQQQQFALAFNATTDGKAPPIEEPPMVWGLRPIHLAIAIVMALFWMVWGLPMMLAWAALGTFAHRTDPRFRTEIARSLETISGVVPVVGDADQCANPDCRAPMPETAIFCPRCGQPAGGAAGTDRRA